MDLLNTAIATGLKAYAQAGGVTITYRRAAEELAITAVRGRTTIEELTPATSTRADLADWIIEDYADLLTTFTEPQRGDRIEDPNGVLFEVHAMDDEHCFDWVGNARQAIRIHSVEIDTV